MISSKVFALMLLLVCPLALARVQFNTTMELKNSPRYGNRTSTTEIQLDLNTPLEIYNLDDVRIEAELLAEKDENAVICYSIYAKNESDDFEKILAPVLVPGYGKEATLVLGSTSGDGFTLKVIAQKV